MSLTNSRVKIKNDGQLRNYISYFQSVTTVGIISRGYTMLDAEKKAKEKFVGSDISCGIVSQTPFEISETEPWNPDFYGFMPSGNLDANMLFGFNDITKQRIAEKMDKKAEEVTEADYVSFVKNAVEKSLQN
jgi:hypothetical protein